MDNKSTQFYSIFFLESAAFFGIWQKNINMTQKLLTHLVKREKQRQLTYHCFSKIRKLNTKYCSRDLTCHHRLI